MKFRLLKGKSRRTKIFSAITVLSLVVIIALNLLLYNLGVKETLFVDMTPEGLYTVSDLMEEECDEIFGKLAERDKTKKIRVTFCTDPDYLIGSTTARITYFMCLKLQNEYPDAFEVVAVNAQYNPTAVSQYKATSLSKINANNVIVSYGDRYRVATIDYFWTTGSSTIYYNGEYKMASLMRSVSAISQPKAYFVTNHGETYYDPNNKESEMSASMASFADLLADLGLEIKLLDLSAEDVDRIPEDCALLIINNPRTDFTFDPDRLDEYTYVSETEMLDRYLTMNQGAVIVAKDYRITLPVFEDFLHEWGFKFSDSVLVDSSSSIADKGNTGTDIIAVYDQDSEGYAYAIYGDYASLSSAPSTIVSDAGSVSCSFKDSASVGEQGTSYANRTYAPYLFTSQNAQRYMRDPITGEVTTIADGAPGRFDLAALSVRSEIDSIENLKTYSYLFCVNSTEFFSNKLLGESSYANYDIVSALINNISRIDEYADMDLGGPSLNSAQLGGKLVISMDMSTSPQDIYSNKYDSTGKLIIIKSTEGISTAGKVTYTCLAFVIPLALVVLGIVVFVKRRRL